MKFTSMITMVAALLLLTGVRAMGDECAVDSGNYKAELCDGRVRLLWKNEVLVKDFMPLLVAKNWAKIYANENYLAPLTQQDCTVSGKTLSIVRNQEGAEFKFSVAVDAKKGFQITVKYHTPHSERLELEQLFLMLPQLNFEKSLYYSGEELKRLPPRIGFDSNRNTRERMSPNAAELEIFRDFGVVRVASSDATAFLYDTRYHIWKGNSQRSFALVIDKIPDNQEVTINLSVEEREAVMPDAGSLEAMVPFRQLTEAAPRHVILDETRSLDLRTGNNAIQLDTTVLAPAERAFVAVFTGEEGIAPRLYGAAQNGKVTFALPASTAEIAFGAADTSMKRIRFMSEPAPVMPDSPAKLALELLDNLKSMDSDRLNSTRDALAALYGKANTKLPKSEFEQMVAELKQIEKLTGKLNILNRNDMLADALERGYFLYSSSSTEKIYNREPLSPKLNPQQKQQLRGARNEHLNFQITAVTLFDDLKEVSVSGLTLKNTEGETIPMESVIYSIEDIVSGADIVPDLLSKNTTVDIDQAADSRSWWINFKIPAEIAAGKYHLEVKFSGEKLQPGKVKADLKVFNFKLSENFDAVAVVGAFTQELRALPDYRPEMEDEILEMLIARGFYVTTGLSHPRYMDDYDYRLNRFYRQQIERYHYLQLFSYPYMEWLERFYTNGKLPSGEAYREMAINTMLANAAQLKKDGLLDYAYAYYDEVEKDDQRVLDFIRSIRSKSGLKFALAFHKPAFGTDYVEFYAKDTDLFYFSSSFLERDHWVEYMKQLKKRGKKLGVYFNIVYPSQPTCNVIDAPALAHRTLFWTQWKYDINYNLFWGVNCWWANLDMQNTQQSVNNRGDGILLYRDTRSEGYAISLRLEIMREGVQDYRYLRMLDELRKKAAAHPNAVNYKKELGAASELLKINWLKDSRDVPLDANILLGEREKCAALIELFQKIVNNGNRIIE